MLLMITENNSLRAYTIANWLAAIRGEEEEVDEEEELVNVTRVCKICAPWFFHASKSVQRLCH